MSCTCGNPKAAFTLKVTSIIAHTGISIPLPSPTLQSFTENWAPCDVFNSMTEESKPHLCWTLLTWPITYKVTTTSILGVYFTWSGTETLWQSKSAHCICAENNYKKNLPGPSFWWNEPYHYSLSRFIPHISIVYSAFESLELLKHNLEAWDHTYAWLLNNSLRGIINNKIHWNSVQNKTRSFLMSKQKNEALVHLVPSELSLGVL